MKNTENVVIKKECHSQEFLLGISHIRFRKGVGSFKQVEDPRQNSSGMTTLFNNGAVVGQALPDNAPTKGHLTAFTLIELLVVVLIIGILAAVAVPQYKIAVEKSKATQALVLIRTIGQAGDAFFLANGSNINSFSELGIAIPANWTGKEKYMQGSQMKDPISNGEWSALIDSQNVWNAVIIGRIKGRYERRVAFKYAWKSSDANTSKGLGRGKLFCVEDHSLSPKGEYCEKLFHGKKIQFESAEERFYEMP